VNLGYTYSPRGFVKQKTVSGQAINFTQNAIGLTTEVRTPDNQVFTLIYDTNHRLTDIKQNGASITVSMLNDGSYPDGYLKAQIAQLQQVMQTGADWLISPAFAQVPVPLPPPVVPVPGQPMPGQPNPDPFGGLTTMSPMSPAERAMRSAIEAVTRMCQCDPKGGYSKPTLTPGTYAHISISGHLAPVFSNKSYFSVPVNQAFVDEIVSKGIKRPRVIQMNTTFQIWAD
jgi:YD repeat-containing protein